MQAKDEIARLQEKIQEGSMTEDEPLFCLRAQDKFAPVIIRLWAELCRLHGTPEKKVDEALELAASMTAWPVEQIPGVPASRTVVGEPS
jgi:hypothetical protein